MTFFDWIGFAASGIQSFFAWATFNRDAFVDNVALRQNQKYQQKNYHISWIAIARDDVRDMMGISVNRINNYMIVATLILSVAAGAVMSVSFDDADPDYLVYEFYLSIGVSIIYLMLAIMFGVKGQNCAFTNTMKLLTCKIRPENPADYNHDYMQQAQWIEQCGVTRLFRIPGLNPNYGTGHEKLIAEGKDPDSANVFSSLGHTDEQKKASDAASPSLVNLEAATPLESLFTRSTHLWYLTKFGRFMKLWQPYDTYSKYSMGLGIICLGQGSAYFSLGQLLAEGRHLTYWAACAMTFAFIYMVVLVTTQNFKAKSMLSRGVVYAMLAAGPLLSTLAAVTDDIWVDRFAVPLSFFSHFVFWLAAFLLAQRSEDMQGEGMDWLSHGSGMRSGRERYYQQAGAPDQLAVAATAAPTGAAAVSQASPAASTSRWSHGGSVGTVPRGHDPALLRRQDDGQQHAQAPYGGVGHGNGALWQEYLGDDGDAAAADHWPTDDLEFEFKTDKTNESIKRTVRQTLVASAMMWFAMFLWSVVKYSIEIPDEYKANVGVVHAPAGVQDVPVQWPSPLFRPHSVACADAMVFLADRFSIFNSTGSRMMERVRCPLSRPIADVAAFCQGSNCRPLALVHGGGKPPEVVDCGSGQANRLLLEDSSAQLLTVRMTNPQGGLRSQRLIAAQSSGELVQYVWSSSRNGWEPEWFLGKVESEVFGTSRRHATSPSSLRAIAVANDDQGGSGRVLLFRDGRSASGLPAVQARDLNTMDREGAWSFPTASRTLGSGCAVDAGFSALALLDVGDSPDGPPPSLLRLRLA